MRWGVDDVPQKRVDFPATIEIDVILKYCKPIETMSAYEQIDIGMLKNERDLVRGKMPVTHNVLEYITKYPELYKNGGEYFKSGSKDSYVPYVRIRPGVWDQLTDAEKKELTDSIRKNISNTQEFGILETVGGKDRWLYGLPWY